MDQAMLGRGLLVLAALCAWWAAIGGSARAAECPNEAIRLEQNTTSLPDCRAYEVVTPLTKESDIAPLGSNAEGRAADDGEKLLFGGVASFAGSTSGVNQGYVTSRGSNGWTTVPVTPPTVKGDAFYNLGPTALNLSSIAVNSNPAAFNNFFLEGGGPKVLYGPPHGPYHLLADFPLESGGIGVAVGGSHDLGVIAFQSNLPEVVDPPATGTTAGQTLYQSINGQNQLVGVDDAGTVIGHCGSVLGNGYGNDLGASEVNTVSGDGSTLFFLSPDPAAGFADPSCSPNSQLYARIDATRTVEVSAPEAGVTDPNGPQPVVFAGASVDGRKVFFVSNEELTADDTTTDPELYEYEFGTGGNPGTLTRISRGESGTADGNVRWVVTSDNGSQVYFVARGEQIAGQGAPGGENLYRYDTEDHTYSFVTTLSASDISRALRGPSSYAGTRIDVSWLASPDGRHLLFQSELDLAGPDPSVNLHRLELYRYSADQGTIVCVSCSAMSGPPSPVGLLIEGAEFAHGIVLGLGQFRRAMSPDGGYVFFDTPEQLLPADVNKRRDVYEWHAGELSLLSSGTSSLESWFVDASTDFRDVFFSTSSKLLPSDENELSDIYDARVGGGFPESASAGPPCAGDECQGPLGAAPGFSESGSSALKANPSTSGPVKPKSRKPRSRCAGHRTAKHRGHAHKRARSNDHAKSRCTRRNRRAGK